MLAAVLIIFVVVFSAYIVARDPDVVHPYAVTITTCACWERLNDSDPAMISEGKMDALPPNGTVADTVGLGFINAAPNSAVSGRWYVSNDTDVIVVLLFAQSVYTNDHNNTTSESGTFSFAGPPLFGWPAEDPAYDAVAVSVLAPYPVAVTFQGNYTSPALGWFF